MIVCHPGHWNPALMRCDLCGVTAETLYRVGPFVLGAAGRPVPIGTTAGGVEIRAERA